MTVMYEGWRNDATRKAKLLIDNDEWLTRTKEIWENAEESYDQQEHERVSREENARTALCDKLMDHFREIVSDPKGEIDWYEIADVTIAKLSAAEEC